MRIGMPLSLPCGCTWRKRSHAADVAGVDADLVDGMVERGQGHLVVEVDVADERELDALLDLAKHRGVLRLGHGDADELAAGLFQAVDLRDGGLDVVGVGRGHRLHPDRVVAADDDVADGDLAGLVPAGRGAGTSRPCIISALAVSYLETPSTPDAHRRPRQGGRADGVTAGAGPEQRALRDITARRCLSSAPAYR